MTYHSILYNIAFPRPAARSIYSRTRDTILPLMRFPLALTAKIAAYIIGHKLRGTQKFATVLQLEPLHTCNLTCTGCGRIREYSTTLKDMMTPGGLPRGGAGMRRADGLHLRRRTADLPADRGAGERIARAEAHRLHLHERHVHAQKNARMAGDARYAKRRNSSKEKLRNWSRRV